MNSENPFLTKIYDRGDFYFEDVLQSIHAAEKEIMFESYIFDYDPVGIPLLDALGKAHQRGVRVRLLVDAIGSFNWSMMIEQKCRQMNLPFRLYHPIPFQYQSLRRISWRNLRKLLFLFRRLNRRNHRKMIIIDKKICFIGSRNISQVHSEYYMGSSAWKDVSIRFDFSSAPVSAEIQACRVSFQRAWHQSRWNWHRLRRGPMSIFSRRFFLAYKSLKLIHTHFHRRSRLFFQRQLHRWMKKATQRIYITNAYFIPKRSLLRTLVRASKRGVDVRVCLPEKTDVRLVQWASRAVLYQLLRKGIKIYQYQKSVMHSKTMIIDNKALIGSKNLNHRSLLHDLEIEAVLEDPSSVDKMIQIWKSDLQNSRILKLQHFENFSWIEKSFYKFIYWFRYWL
jgi:cardiolipin synthase